MEKTVRRNIMAIYGDSRIFRRILKHDLALDGWRYLVDIDGEHLAGGELLVKTTSEVVLRSDLLLRGLV